MIGSNQDSVEEILLKISGLSETESLKLLATQFQEASVFSTSFSFEDQVITDLLVKMQLPVEIFTLDTGRLFPETYSTWVQTLEKYNTRVTAYYPDATALQEFVAEKGPNSFYESVENRKSCCHIRKVEPLQRALKGKKLWITGIRSEHSQNRNDMQPVEWDAVNQVLKYHPLLHWTTEQVKEYIRQNNVPYNPLHDKGFVSIGCAPCTRAVRPGEDFRAGRWWWEDSSKKECGLHVHEEATVKQ
ncbi:MAG: phosphoadenylyl-sulfate reductase [Chitinophagaceae bacterium]|nr:phosphoadenylyl-sulfate reductase [Chitinophagaceae bacterium]